MVSISIVTITREDVYVHIMGGTGESSSTPLDNNIQFSHEA